MTNSTGKPRAKFAGGPISLEPEPRYWPYYCEENAWHLSRHPALSARRTQVVFVSNLQRRVAMWGQRAADGAGAPVIWDYHAFVVTRDAVTWVWDLDTELGLPVEAAAYFAGTFPYAVPPALQPWFRVVPAATYVSTLISDRSHMCDDAGDWLKAPPPWPPIGQGAPNLARFHDPTDDEFVGQCVDLAGLRELLVEALGPYP